jgi:predicted DNA-binding protein with PD1-like motif
LLGGSIAANGSHLHMRLADATGGVPGGHVARRGIVRIRAEVLRQSPPGWSFLRSANAHTGWAALLTWPRG